MVQGFEWFEGSPFSPPQMVQVSKIFEMVQVFKRLKWFKCLNGSNGSRV